MATTADLIAQARHLGSLEVVRDRHARWARPHWRVTLRTTYPWTDDGGAPMTVTITAEGDDLGAVVLDVITAAQEGR